MVGVVVGVFFVVPLRKKRDLPRRVRLCRRIRSSCRFDSAMTEAAVRTVRKRSSGSIMSSSSPLSSSARTRCCGRLKKDIAAIGLGVNLDEDRGKMGKRRIRKLVGNKLERRRQRSTVSMQTVTVAWSMAHLWTRKYYMNEGTKGRNGGTVMWMVGRGSYCTA